MKVLQINSVFGIGSTGRIVLDLYDTLLESHNDCVVAFGRKKYIDGYKTIKIGSKASIFKQVFLTRIFDLHSRFLSRSTKKLILEIEKYKPDIIQLHNIHGYYIDIKVIFEYFKESNIPVVWTLHDCWAFTGHCAYFDMISCQKWETQCKKCGNRAQYPKSIIFDNSTKNYEMKKKIFNNVNSLHLVTPSIWLSQMVKKSFLKDIDSKIIYTGINLDLFKPSDNNTFRKVHNIENNFIILGVANIWDKRKGFDDFIKLSKMISEDDIIVLIGLSKKQSKLLPKNIIGLERTNNIEELANLYSTSNVFFNPTLEEMFGLVNIEALACGTPVITYNSGGSPESITKDTGFIVEKGNLETTMECIFNLKKNPVSINDCVDRAKEFNQKSKFMEYIKLYEEILR